MKLMKIRRPDWLRRLREWRAEKENDIREVVGGTVLYALLALIFLALSQEYPFLSWFAVPGALFAVLTIFGVLYFIVLMYQIMAAKLAYNIVEIGYLSAQLLLTLLGKIVELSLHILSRVGVSSLFTPIAIFVVLLIHKLWEPVDIKTPDLVYLLVVSGLAKELIEALVRRVVAKREERE